MLDQPAKNKMMTTPPAKKEFFFAPTAEHYAEVVYAATIEEAEAIYHKVKRLINPTQPFATLPNPPEPQSTATVDEEITG